MIVFDVYRDGSFVRELRLPLEASNHTDRDVFYKWTDPHAVDLRPGEYLRSNVFEMYAADVCRPRGLYLPIGPHWAL